MDVVGRNLVVVLRGGAIDVDFQLDYADEYVAITGALLRMNPVFKGDEVAGWRFKAQVYASPAYAAQPGAQPMLELDIHSPGQWVFKTQAQIDACEFVAPTKVFNPDPYDAFAKVIAQRFPAAVRID